MFSFQDLHSYLERAVQGLLILESIYRTNTLNIMSKCGARDITVSGLFVSYLNQWWPDLALILWSSSTVI